MVDLLHPHAEGFSFPGTNGNGVVVLHGWTGSPAHLRLIGGFLNDHGYSIEAPRLPGHGTHVSAMEQTSWRDWLRAAGEAAQAVLDRGERLHLVGLSMGGILSILIAPTFDPASVTTINAPQRVQNRLGRAAGFLHRWKPYHEGEIREPPQDEAADYWHQYDGFPTRAIHDLFLLVRASRTALPRLTAPLLVIQSKVDETVRPVSAQTIHDRAGSDEKRILWLERSRHVALLDSERNVIHGGVLGHLEAARGSA
ncbi:MAG: alpha/beta fold hydrolase [Acidimicrobiia bacterium]|nr:alpha/beta fold hydrolase [Acidimicrobiia bacterium]